MQNKLIRKINTEKKSLSCQEFKILFPVLFPVFQVFFKKWVFFQVFQVPYEPCISISFISCLVGKPKLIQNYRMKYATHSQNGKYLQQRTGHQEKTNMLKIFILTSDSTIINGIHIPEIKEKKQFIDFTFTMFIDRKINYW